MTFHDPKHAAEQGRKGAAARWTKARAMTRPLLQLADFADKPVAFMRALVDTDTGEAFDPYPEEIAFLEAALVRTKHGRLPYPELLYSAPKKSGKTTLAAVILLYVVLVVGGKNAEGLVLANDYDQAQGRVFTAAVKIIRATPWLKPAATITRDRILFRLLGATIDALASDAAGAAGANPVISVFDELWGYTSERATRLWDEMVPPPTRKVACRLTVSYAGFSGESKLLETFTTRVRAAPEIAPDLHALSGELLGFLTHRAVAPWQTPEWLQEMRAALRAGAYLRMIEN